MHVKVTRLCSVYGVQLRCQGRQSAVSCQNWFTSFFASLTKLFCFRFLTKCTICTHTSQWAHFIRDICTLLSSLSYHILSCTFQTGHSWNLAHGDENVFPNSARKAPVYSKYTFFLCCLLLAEKLITWPLIGPKIVRELCNTQHRIVNYLIWFLYFIYACYPIYTQTFTFDLLCVWACPFKYSFYNTNIQ